MMKISVLTLSLMSFISSHLFAATLVKLKPSIYYIQTIDLDKNCTAKKNIVDEKGTVLFQVCKENYKTCVIEGTCALAEGNDEEDSISLINFVRQDKAGRNLFKEVNTEKCPYGLGVQNTCLDPYYTVAADLRFNKVGDVLFIPKLKGVVLPNGEVHPGFMIVRDRGGAIKGAHRFDFYTGFQHYLNPENPLFDLGFSTPNNKIDYRKASPSEAEAFKKLRKYPLIPESTLN